MVWALVFAMRRLDSVRLPVASVAWTTVGMNSDCGIGEFPAFGVTLVTRVTETGIVVAVPLSRPCGPDFCAAWLKVINESVPVLLPAGRPFGSALMVRSIPSEPIVPAAGVTRSQGLSMVAVNRTAGVLPGM